MGGLLGIGPLAAFWVSDGTEAGTTELSIPGAASGGPFTASSPDFTPIGSEALFAGTDAGGRTGLWITDGTAGGTSELNVAGAAFGGVSPAFFTPLGSNVVFLGRDPGGNEGLWVTDGTGPGTSEIASVTNSQGGLVGPNLLPNFTPFGNRLLFTGYDAGGLPQLWVTDGTAAGSSELSPGANASFGADPTDATALGSS